MFCPECGETIDDGAQFCPNCGARFSEEDITEVAKDKPGKKSPLVPILAIVAVVLGLGVGIGLYATQNKKADKKAEEQAKKIMEQQAAEMQKIMEQINQMKGAAAETTVAAGVAATGAATTNSAFKPAQPAVKRFCSNCGAPRGNGKFCSKCGKPL